MHATGSLTYRLASASDAPSLVDVYAERLTASQRAWAPVRPDGALALFEQHTAHEFPYGVIVAERNGELLGYCSLVPFRSAPALRGTMGESSICVREAERTRGVARGLIARVTDAARYGGLEYQLAYIDPTNAAAIATATSTGAIRVGGLPAPARNPDRPPVDLYVWNLSAPTPPTRDAVLARLVLQADRLAPLELDVFDRARGTRGRVVDLGCGPGAWITAMQRLRPGLAWLGIDRDSFALARLTDGAETSSIDLASDPDRVAAAAAAFGPDLVVLRFVLQHLAPEARVGLLRALHASGLETLLIIDTDDQQVDEPTLRLLLDGAHAFARARGADRDVLASVPDELRSAGWHPRHRTEIELSSVGDADALALMSPVAEAGLRCAPTHARVDAFHRLDGPTARRYRYGAMIATRAGSTQ